MRNNPVQFAVVREDPLTEAAVLENLPQAKNTLLIASGGCTALSLQSKFPEMQFTLVDVNPSQLELVRKKTQALRTSKGQEFKNQFNIEDSRTSGLNAGGNFESLFRCLREFVFEFIMPYGEMRNLFEKEHVAQASRERIFSNKYWPVGFEMYFCDPLLRAMFGEQAVQHAPKGSYPVYFRNALESGFQKIDARNNYFLHHIFLGHYFDRESSLPLYLSKPPKECRFEFILGSLFDVKGDWKQFDFVSISNLFDWMDDKQVAEIARFLTARMRPDAKLLFRQLNHDTDFTRHFGTGFSFDEERGRALLAKDRSLFYSKINVGTKT